MSAREDFDAVVIGAGQAGPPLARAFAGAGWSTAIVEREHVAGTCINEGCTPTKTMIASARAAYAARRAEGYGVMAGPVTVDMVRVRQRKRDVVESWRTGSERRIAETDGLELIMGEARFIGTRQVEVSLLDGGTRVLAARRIVVNTGAHPSVPGLPGLNGVPYLTSTTVMELDVVPDHLVILGGGYVAVEFAQMFRRFGSDVTILQRSDRLLDREDLDVSEGVADILREDGIEVLFDARALSVDRGPFGGVAATVEVPDGERSVLGSHLLLAVGRTPNTGALAPEKGGVDLDEGGYIRVNERLETSAAGVYAAGDVKGGPAFTHISYDDFRILRTNLIEGGAATTTDRLVPYAVYLDPELGRVGVTEEQARAQGRRIKVAKIPMDWVARALEMDEARGFMKAVVDEETDEILGAAVLGVHGGELMAVLEVAMMGGVTAGALREAVLTHPTLAESLNTLFATWVE